MDPVCHTLTGALMGEAGLKRRTGLATATLIVSANLPDIDVLAHLQGAAAALDFRRGWTHGVLAVAVLPVLLTGGIVAWDQWGRRTKPGRMPVRPASVLLLAVLGVLSHYLLDFLNVYGIRLLMPFSARWFYGDALFIVDPWMWLALGAGVWLTIRRVQRGDPHPRRPARLALGLAAAYIVLMLGGNVAGRWLVLSQLSREERPVEQLMIYPVPVDPFTRVVMYDVGPRIEIARLDWRPLPRLAPEREWLDTNAHRPAARLAAGTAEGRRFLRWARFPVYAIEHHPDATLVHIDDARFTWVAGQSWASVTVRLPPQPSGRGH
jgi:inner membrane protein